jgi:DNA-binding transcriptional LysR family regulator
MDPRRVLTFRAVAHARSFSAAAIELSLSQPSVSNQVSLLEREIGARLLDREPGGLRLTRAGEILLEHADAIAERFALADAQLTAASHSQRTRLRIGAFPTALAGLVPAAVAHLRRAHPDAKVTFEEGADEDLAARVRCGELHLALAFQDAGHPRVDRPGLERHELLRERFLVALAPDHALAERATVRLADLRDAAWIASGADGLIVRVCRDAGFEPDVISFTRDQLAIHALIKRGLAVTLAPQLLADAFAGLALRPIAGPAPARDVYALLPPGGRHPLVAPALDALHAALASHEGASPPNPTR